MIKSFSNFVIILLLFLSSLGYVAFRLQDPHFVLQSARSVNLYGRLAANIEPLIGQDQLNSTGLKSSEVIDLLKSAVDAEQFYVLASQALEAYLPWLTGRDDSISFSYDLTPTKQKLTDGLTAKMQSQYLGLPQCTPAQLRTWSFKDKLPSCRLADGTIQAKNIETQIAALASKTTDLLPDTLTAAQPSTKYIRIRDLIARGFKDIYLVWGLTALLIAIYLLIFRSSGLVSLAVSFLLVGLLEIGFSLIGWDWITRTISDSIGGRGDAKTLLPLTIDLISVIIEALKTTLGNISIGFLLTGGISLLLGIIGKIHQPKLIAKVTKI
ncbi:MAG: hypothetical protein AAB774_02360 [Patescibacteria group bacterium]|mgnify:CR=1 FL=1